MPPRVARKIIVANTATENTATNKSIAPSHDWTRDARRFPAPETSEVCGLTGGGCETVDEFRLGILVGDGGVELTPACWLDEYSLFRTSAACLLVVPVNWGVLTIGFACGIAVECADDNTLGVVDALGLAIGAGIVASDGL
jgi:hypothetical protein